MTHDNLRGAMSTRVALGLVGIFALLDVETSAALTAGEKCEAAKLKAASRYVACRLKAQRTAIITGIAVDYTKCDERFAAAFSAAETRAAGACPSTGDQSATQAQIDGLTDNLASSFAGGLLQDCAGALMTCAGDLATCTANLAQVGLDLTTCNADLTSCQVDLVAALACGDAVVDPGEQCDQSNLNGETCTSRGFGDGTLACGTGCVFDTGGCLSVPIKTIFASSQLMEPGYPNFVYPEGADARCQALANAVPALSGRPFKAAVCGASPDFGGGAYLGIRDRFANSPGRYFDRQGNLIADSLDDFLDGTIANPITIDEYGSQIVIGGGREYAWTGCQGNGASNPANYLCQLGSLSWTTGHVGTTGGKGSLLATTGGAFFDAELEACNAPLHLICVEQ